MAYQPSKNLTPGMNPEQAQKDRGGFSTTEEMLTRGVKQYIFEGHGPVVQNPYDDDVLGEERNNPTFTDEHQPKPAGVGGHAGGTVKTSEGGGMVHAPQTYSKLGGKKD